MKKVFIGASTDLGVNKDGARFGPKVILDKLNKKYINIEADNIKKSQDKFDLKKNINEINNFNEKLYNSIKKEKDFCIMIGGDHSASIASGLASISKNSNLGIIWIDSHLDYNTFNTTITGNLHGLPLASLNGLNKELSLFHDGLYFDPKKTVVIGYRALEENAKDEIENIKTMGVSVYTTNDIKEYGILKILDNAFKIIGDSKVHISFDLDSIDPIIAPGVTVKEKNGLDLSEVNKIIDYLENKKELIASFDLVEYNPLNDINNKTLNIGLDILKKVEKF